MLSLGRNTTRLDSLDLNAVCRDDSQNPSQEEKTREGRFSVGLKDIERMLHRKLSRTVVNR
jgi:hypothetical protein